MAAGSEHLSRSDVQTRAEAEIVEALAAELKIELVQNPPTSNSLEASTLRLMRPHPTARPSSRLTPGKAHSWAGS